MAVVVLANGQEFDTDSNQVSIKPVKSSKQHKGVVLYDGPSVLDGSPILAVASMETKNPKTGDMVQVWIIRKDVSPVEAYQQKLDSAVCGDCPHRHNKGGACYVQVFQGPRAVYEAFHRGTYATLTDTTLKAFEGRSVRLGAYGDPAAVPFEVWERVLKVAKNHTGYTHQAHHKNFDSRIAEICMISADTVKEAQRQQKAGRKTFRIKTSDMPVLQDEIVCLADSKGISCEQCGICDGKTLNVVIDVHGVRKKRFDKFERIL